MFSRPAEQNGIFELGKASCTSLLGKVFRSFDRKIAYSNGIPYGLEFLSAMRSFQEVIKPQVVCDRSAVSVQNDTSGQSREIPRMSNQRRYLCELRRSDAFASRLAYLSHDV